MSNYYNLANFGRRWCLAIAKPPSSLSMSAVATLVRDKRNFWYLIAFCILTLATPPANAQHAHGSPYAGQQTRAVKSLSEDDIEELRRGGGWGLAKAAELNGMPGPLHVLDAQTELGLGTAQVSAIDEIYEHMKSQAIEQGHKLIALERELETHFQNRTITDQVLRETLDAIGKVRTELRYIHLSAHLTTPALLSAEQIHQYNALRGYSVSDPCAAVPEGHNADLWRRHNNCE